MSIAEKLTIVAENVPKVYEAGQKSEYDRFWDAYLSDDAYSTYQTGRFCGSGWNDSTFYPNRDIVVRYGYQWFTFNTVSNIKQRMLDCGVEFNFDNALDIGNMFERAITTELPIIDASNISSGDRCQRLFYYCKNLVTVDVLKLKTDGSNLFGNSFYNCTSLQNIIIEGTIGNNFDIHWSPLTYDSIMSIINHLGTVTDSKTLTLGETNLAKLTDAEKAIATEKGWTLA